jgi:hypothetical protein
MTRFLKEARPDKVGYFNYGPEKLQCFQGKFCQENFYPCGCGKDAHVYIMFKSDRFTERKFKCFYKPCQALVKFAAQIR